MRRSSRSLAGAMRKTRITAEEPSRIEEIEEEMEEEAEEEEEEEYEEEDEDDKPKQKKSRSSGGGSRSSRGSHKGPDNTISSYTGSRGGSGGYNKNKPHKKINVRSGVTLSLDAMVQNCLYFFLVSQHKKVPLKKSDLVAKAMNGQKNSFKEVIGNLKKVLEDVFGMKLIQLTDEDGKSKASTCYIVISKFDVSVAETATMRNLESTAKRAVLWLILCVIFMLNRSIDEELIWTIMNKLSLNKLVCNRREDLGRFLRSEYVAPMYLKLEETTDKDNIITKYSWGLRSHKEFSPYGILKYVAEQFPGKSPADFPLQYNTVLETDKEAMERDKIEDANGENGSALEVDEANNQYTIDSQALLDTGDDSMDQTMGIGQDDYQDSSSD